jgi:uncharacterized membrane protein YcfT
MASPLEYLHLSGKKVNKYPWIDFIRGFAISAIIFLHFGALITKYLEGSLRIDFPVTYLLDHFLTSLRLPSLFFVSGFLVAKSLKMSWVVFFHARLKNLLYVSMVWALITFTVLAILNSESNDLTFLRSLSSVWFILALAFYSAILRLLHGWKPIFLISLAGVFTLLSGAGVISGDGLHWSFLYYFAYFYLGTYVKELPSFGVFIETLSKRSTFLLVLLGYSGLSSLNFYLDPGWQEIVLRAVTNVLGIALALGIFFQIPAKIREFFAQIGRRTLGIYVMQTPFSNVVIVSIFSISGALTNFLSLSWGFDFAVFLLTAIAISVLPRIQCFIDNHLPWLLNVEKLGRR